MAVVFTTLPSGNFVEPNLRLEPTILRERVHLLTGVTSALSRLTRRPTPRQLGHGRSELQENAIAATELIAPQGGDPRTLELKIEYRGTARYADVEGTSFWISVATNSTTVFSTPEGKREYMLFNIEAASKGEGRSNDAQQMLLKVIPPFGFAPLNGGKPTEYLRVRYQLGRELQAFAAAQEGEPTAAPNLFPRMLYFSATTITTLGIGDIQPITELARALVTAEAILGLVIIGLFLNALAVRAAGSRNLTS
jgi:Ion channel